MAYTVRREGIAWVVRSQDGQFQAARRTPEQAHEWADRLTHQPAQNNMRHSIQRIAASLERMEQNRI